MEEQPPPNPPKKSPDQSQEINIGNTTPKRLTGS